MPVAKPAYSEAEKKLGELIVLIADLSMLDERFGATKLNKLLFTVDFLAYRLYGKPITGVQYQKLEHGPCPRPLVPVRDRLEREKAIAIRPKDFFGNQQNRTIALRQAQLTLFEPDEILLVTRVVEANRELSGTDMSLASHAFIGWELAEMGETIPYEVALVSRRKPTYREQVRGLELEPIAERARMKLGVVRAG